jgi:hypothetical protein
MFRLCTSLAATGRGNERVAPETEVGAVNAEAEANERTHTERIEVILREKKRNFVCTAVRSPFARHSLLFVGPRAALLVVTRVAMTARRDRGGVQSYIRDLEA